MKVQVKNAISIKDFLKIGSNYRDIRLLRIGSKKITKNAQELHLMERYFHLLVNTDFLRRDVYDFLVRQRTYKEVSERHGVNQNYLRNIIYREIKRVFTDISDDPYALIRYRDYVPTDEDRENAVQELTRRIELLIENHEVIRANDLTDFMVMDIGDFAEEYTEYDGEIDNAMFKEIVDRLRYLSKPYLNTLFEHMDKKMLGYVIYLLITRERNLSDRDKRNKEVIKDTWFLPDNN